MSSDLSLYAGNKIVRWIGGNAMPSAPAAVYLALFDGDPKGAGTEVTTDVRAAGRVAVPLTVPASGTDNDMVTSGEANFGSSDGPADFSHAAVFDAASSGNLLLSKEIPDGPYSVDAGTAVRFAAGDLVFTIGS